MNLNATDLQRLLNWHESWMEAPLRLSGFTPQSVVDENWVLRMRIREELGRVDPAGLGPLPAGFAPPPIRERRHEIVSGWNIACKREAAS